MFWRKRPFESRLILKFHTQGFEYPADVGYPLESGRDRFYMLETHYNDPMPLMDLESLGPAADNSGLRLHYTSVLRAHDAGILSIGE